MDKTRFSVNWDYRCPFARNAHEHLVVALQSGAPFEVDFVAFSLTQVHIEEGATPAWEDPERAGDLLAGQVGIVLRDRYPDKFLSAHLALFALRHDRGGDLREKSQLADVLREEGIDADTVFSEIESGWPLDKLRKEHERSVTEHQAFGVPTFVSGPEAVFVRIMTRPEGDAALARATIGRVVELLDEHPELNEFKRTSIPR